MATITITTSSFIFIILFYTLSASMAITQLESLPSYLNLIQPLNNATKDASNGDIGVASVTDENFRSLVLNSETLVLVEFFTPRCGPCKNVDSIMTELANDYAGEVKFFKLNVDENQIIPSRYMIQGIPNVLFFKNGEQRDTLFGNRPKATFIKRMEPNL